MSPLSFGTALLAPGLQGITQAAGAGVDFLGAMLTSVPARSASEGTISTRSASEESLSPAAVDLQRLIAVELRRAGYGEALPLEIADDGFGAIRVSSDHADRRQIEQLLNDHPLIARQFQRLRSSTEFTSTVRLAIPANVSFEASA